MKKSYTAIACALAMTALPAANAELTANIGATSNYLWRGVSQTDDQPAISGGIDYAHESGFYLGTWASNVEFDTTGTELDIYGGFSGEVGSLGYDLGVIFYLYPDIDDSDFTEVVGSLSYGPLEGGVAFTVDTDAGGEDNHVYYWAGASFEVAPSWSVGGTIGHYNFDGDGDYTHGQIDVTKTAGDFGDFTFTLSKAEEESGDEDAKVVISWSKSF